MAVVFGVAQAVGLTVAAARMRRRAGPLNQGGIAGTYLRIAVPSGVGAVA